MTRTEWAIVAAAAALSWGHAVWQAGSGIPGPESAAGYLRALEAASGEGGVGALAGWMGLGVTLVGRSIGVAVASLAPFHWLAAIGLWRGGIVLGGRIGGAWALLAGLGCAGALAYGAEARAAFPVFACVVYAVAAGLERRWVAVATAVGLGGLVGWPVEAGGLGVIVDVAGPAVLGGVVAGLLARGDVVILGLLAGAGALVAGAFAGVDTGLAAAGVLAIAGAGAARVRWVVPGLGLVALVQMVGFHTAREGWPGRPVALRGPVGELPEVGAPLDWLASKVKEGPGRVAVVVEHEVLTPDLLAIYAHERVEPLTFVMVDAAHPLEADADLGLIIAKRGQPIARQGWRAQLPPATERWELPGDYVVEAWDRGLPPETLLATPEEAEKRNHPAKQALWTYMDDGEVGPLIENASSAEVVETPGGVEALFVRDQALWRATSATGWDFGPARPLTDASGTHIQAFDPNVVTLADGTVRLYAAELVGTDRNVDPALHPTRIASWRGPSLDALVREPGVRLEGVGIVDPSARREPDGTWKVFVTEDRRRVSVATSPDGLTFGPPAFVTEGTVPAQSPLGLLVQRQVMGWSVLYAVDERAGTASSLEICATGASSAGRLYYTRSAETCPEPVVLPARRSSVFQDGWAFHVGYSE